MAERFGWDLSDGDGWGRLDFRLLGTSYGGRIPRKDAGKQSRSGNSRSDPGGGVRKGTMFDDGYDSDGSRGKREERRERMRMRREELVRTAKMGMLGVNTGVVDDGVLGAPRKAQIRTAKEILGLGRGNLAGDVLEEKRKAGKGGQGGSPFPGRQAILDKVRKLR